jgi:serine/threonine-protein phosphatase 2A regulatory subunit B
MAAMESDAQNAWHFAQCFGDKGEVEDITEGKHLFKPTPKPSLCHPWMDLEHFTDTCAADIISTVEFDHTGDYLATGDKGGRVVLFERNEQVR